jgi:hypothetical protein
LPIPAEQRSTYRITLRPEPGVDGIKALRGALKILGRRFGMTATGVEEIKPQTDAAAPRGARLVSASS